MARAAILAPMSPSIDFSRELDRLIELWDKHSDRPWNVSTERHGLNVGLINAYVAHSVNLSRAVRVLDREGLAFECVSLVRSTMESAATAAWLALYPEKTTDFTLHTAKERKKTLEKIAESGYSDGEPGLIENKEFLAAAEKTSIDPQGKWLEARFKSMAGGDQLYLTYRVLCSWDHATGSLADEYLRKVDQTERNPWGIVLLDRAESQTSWVGMQAALLLRAQIAADMVLTKPRHQTQLRKLARRFGVSETIEPAA